MNKTTMNRIILGTAVLVTVIGGIAAVASVVAQQQPTPAPWSGCCGMSQWPAMGPGMMGRGMMGGGMMGGGSGSTPRMHFAMMSGVPAPYNSMSNPLPRIHETVERGATVYVQNCASCHGTTGAGDGPVGRTLSPPPANLAFLSQMPMVQWDPFMYWTVAEGGAQFGSAMPAFKGTLPQDDIWAVIAYVQAPVAPERCQATSKTKILTLTNTIAVERRETLVREAFQLEYLTVAWMVLKASVAIGSGISAPSSNYRELGM